MARAFTTLKDLLRLKTHQSLLSQSKISLCHSNPSLISSSSSPFFNLYNTTPSINHILHLLKTCQNMTHLYQIQANLTTSSLFQNPSFSSRILNLSAQYAHIDYTLLLFKCLSFPDTFCYNIVVKACALSCLPDKAVVFYFDMLKNGVLPNSYTFVSLFKACVQMGCVEIGLKCHGQAVKIGVDWVLQVENCLIHMYGCFGLIDVAKRLFVEMFARDLVSWNSMVDAFVKVCDLSSAHKLFDCMPHKNVISWNVLISGYLSGGNPGCGLKLFREMVVLRFKGNDTTMVSVVTACGRSARIKEGKSVHGHLIRTLLWSSLIINTALIDMYSKCRRTDIARKVFERLDTRNLVCWNAMILGHCLHGNPRDGLELFSQMHTKTRLIDCRIDYDDSVELCEAVLPDEVTYIGVLCACLREGLLKQGIEYFKQMTDVFGVKPNFAHYWCMANILASSGLMLEAMEILRYMPSFAGSPPELTLWAVVLGLCRFKGNMVLGEQIAKTLIDQDPQNQSYHALLMAVYAVAGQWEEVVRTKETMKERGFKKMPGYTLADLKCIVHNLEVGNELYNRYIQHVDMEINQ
ncbi:pentatricopeptide repeat-containing protein At3g51320-like [Apium graveolens]|uniref:pentatricopeptide repeat-containing protein At3g51320-like n=1 Tax=Apium graveolens TaxID=4045 RepID=UPI003D7A06CC